MSGEDSPRLAKAFAVIFDGVYAQDEKKQGKILSELKGCYIAADHELNELLENPPSAKVWGLNGILSEIERLVKYQFERVSKTTREFATMSNMKKLDVLVQTWEKQKTILKWIKVMARRVSARAANSGRNEEDFEKDLKEKLELAFHDSFYDFFKQDLGDEVTAVLNRIRNGEVTESSDAAASVKNVLDFYEMMGQVENKQNNEVEVDETYEKDFEPYFLTGTETYYKTRAAEWDRQQDSGDFLKKVENAYQKEKDIVSTYLRPTTLQKLHAMLNKVLVQQYKRSFLDREGSGCKALLKSDLSSANPSVVDKNKRDQLKRMVWVLQKLPDEEGLALMAEIFQSVINEEGEKIYLDRKERIAQKKATKEKLSDKDKYFDVPLVKALSVLHSKFTSVTASILDGLPIFEVAAKKALTSVMNMTIDDEGGLTATICAYVCDQGLDKNGVKSSEVTVDTIIDDLFDYLDDKDKFEHSYRDLLGKRLLRDRSESADEELRIISKLTLKCGKNFTVRMGTMLNDLSSSHEQLKLFRKKQSGNMALKKDDFDIKVFSQSAWNKYIDASVNLPTVLASQKQMFVDFYKKENSESKKLDFAYTMGDVEMRMMVAGKKGPQTYTLSVSTLQATVLDFFNQSTDMVPYSVLETQIALHVKDNKDALKILLGSMVFGKVKLLKKDPESKSILSTDRFGVNEAFSSKKKKIKIPPPSLEKKASSKNVEEDRTHALDACIVRVMKTRQQMDHGDLVAEVFKQTVLFKPNMKSMKRQIESLINREYLRRVEGTTKTYEYLA